MEDRQTPSLASLPHSRSHLPTNQPWCIHACSGSSIIIATCFPRLLPTSQSPMLPCHLCNCTQYHENFFAELVEICLNAASSSPWGKLQFGWFLWGSAFHVFNTYYFFFGPALESFTKGNEPVTRRSNGAAFCSELDTTFLSKCPLARFTRFCLFYKSTEDLIQWHQMLNLPDEGR